MKGGRRSTRGFYRMMGRVGIRVEEVVLKINFYLSVLPRAGSDPGHERDKTRGGE